MRRIFVALAALLATSCGPPRWETLPQSSPADPPQRGGELNVGTVYVTLSALSWDPADWTWKSNHDTGMTREQLFSADLSKAVSRGGSQHYTLDAYIPPDVMRGELAESWEWEDPLTLAVRLRRGVMYPERPGFMKARELDAEDVVYTYEYVSSSPKRINTYFQHVDRVEARDSHTVVFHFNTYNTEWAYRFGYGYYSSIIPRESKGRDLRDWKNVTGTGPFFLDRYIQGSVQSFSRNPGYWDRDVTPSGEQSLPYLDRVTYRIIKDEATWITALRTGKLDVLEIMRWSMAKHLMETTPELQWNRWLATQGTSIALRTDRPPLNDVRVRRALNMAINKQEIVDLASEGQAELMAFPQHPEFGRYFQPLEEMPESVQELFAHDPEKAKALLKEAGLPDGFEFTVQVCSCNPSHMDLLPLIVDAWSKIGVRAKIQPLEYAAFLSAMTTRTHSEGYLFEQGHVSPTSTLRKNFETGQLWNPALFSDPAFDAKLARAFATRDEEERIRLVRELTIEGMDAAPYIWLPTAYVYTAWWPWVRNYGGELRAGAVRPGPIYARVWIDHELKKTMGFR